MRIIFRVFIFSMALLVLSGCDKKKSATSDDKRPLIVTTTTMLTDLTRQLGGDVVRVEGIVKPGSDPHLYQPTPQDARLVASSQMVVKSGLNLEGWIDDLLENAGGTRPIVDASTRVKPIKMEGKAGGVDPHFWFDLEAWSDATRYVGSAMISLVGKDTPEADIIRKRLESYLQQIGRLDVWVRDQLMGIPSQHRVLVTSHDAFAYFGRAYKIEVVSAQGISTEQKASQRDLANLIEKVKKQHVKAVFSETSVNPALIEQVARETDATVKGPLYSDSIGAPDGPASTFVGTVAENIRIIVESLGGEYFPFTMEP